MNYLKRTKIVRLIAISSLLTLVGCQLSVEKRRSSMDAIQLELQEAKERNQFISKKGSLRLPDEIRAALMPNPQGSVGKNIPLLEKRFDLFADQVPSRTFFLSLVEDTPYNITVHPNVEGKISLQLKKVSIPEVLETVRNVYGYDFRQTTQGIEVLPATLQTRSFHVNYLDVNRGGQSETQVSAGTLKSSTSSSSGSSSSGSANTSSSASDSSSQSGGGSSGSGSSGGQGINSKITTRSKADFWSELQIAVEAIIGTGEGRKVAISPLSSLIVVQAMPDELKKVEEFLKSAELSLNRQVILEAKIIEVELNDSFQAGINWSLVNGRIQSTLFGGDVIRNGIGQGSSFPIPEGGSSSPINVQPGKAASNAANNVNPFGGIFALTTNFRNLGAFIESLGAQGKVHVLSSPRVSTMNNQKALIKVGSDRFFVTNVSTTSTATTATTAQPTSNVTFDSFFSGIALDVTPQVNENGVVTLHIHPTISSVEDDTKNITVNGQSQSYPLAKSSVRESDNMVQARNGEMVIIGGLMQNQTSDLKEGIPILKDLPLLGNAFRHTVQTTKKSELVILLRPIVVESKTWANKLDETSDRFRRLEEEEARDENKFHCKGPNCQ